MSDPTAASAQSEEHRPERRVSVPVMMAYGTGDLAQAVANIGIPSLLLFYYQQIVGLSGTLTGLAIGISLFFDAVTDPIVGGLSDRLKGRFGRRHPLMAVAPIPAAICFIFLFSPPDGLSESGNFLWLTGFAVLFRTAMTFFYIPHLALGAELASDYNQRSTLFAVKTLILGVAYSAVGMSVYFLLFPTTPEFDPGLLDASGYQRFAWWGAVLMIVGMVVCVLGTAREIPYLRSNEATTKFSAVSLWRDMGEVFRDRDFLAIFLGFILCYLFGFVELASIPFMGVHFWGLRTEQVAYSSAVLMASIPVSFLLTPVLTRTLDKKATVMGCLLAAIIAPNVPICLRLLDVSWYPATGSPWVLINWLTASWIATTCGWITYSLYLSILADVADSHELRTGKRREGAIYSTQAFSGKAASAFGMMILGAILDWIAFPNGAVQGSVPAEVLWDLGLFVGPAPSIFSAAGALFFLLYRIDRARHAEIMHELDARKARARAAAFSPATE